MSVYIAIGSAIVRTIGLAPDTISNQAAARFPGRATFAGMHYQRTGMDEEITNISAITHPHVVGGMDAVALLKQIQRRQSIVPLIRLGAGLLGSNAGRVGILDLIVDEDRPHPKTAIGRKVSVDITLVHLGSI